jgi:hypothetical protein
MTEHHGDDDLCASGQAKIDRIYRQLEINLKKPSKLAVCAKWFITIVCSSLLLICVIMSKFAVLELASLMTVDGICGNTTNELQDKCENSFILLVIILLAPNIHARTHALTHTHTHTHTHTLKYQRQILIYTIKY